MMGYWLHDGYARVPGYYDYTVYSQLLGEGRDTFDTQPVVSSSGNVPCALCVCVCVHVVCTVVLSLSLSVCLCPCAYKSWTACSTSSLRRLSYIFDLL